MRLPFPERIPFLYALAFGLLLGTVELMQGTPLSFAMGVLLFIVFSTLAFNVAGGFTRPSGAYVFFNAMLTAILGLVYKAWLGESADSNLRDPQMTILVYNVGMMTMLAACYISRRFSSREGLLRNALPLNRMQGAVYGCIGLGLASYIANIVVTSEAGHAVLTALNQLDRFMLMAILLGVTHQVRKTGGRSFLSFAVVFAAGWSIFVGGLLGFSKEGFLIPTVAVLLTAASLGYRFSIAQMGAILAATFLFFYYLIPYAQYGRLFRDYDTTFSQQVTRSVDLLTHPEDVRVAFKSTQDYTFKTLDIHYYDTPQGFWDRLQMIGIDDALIDYTEKQHTFGYLPIVFGFENIVPHFLWKSKPIYLFGNLYAHEIDLIPPADTTTGISFSPTAQAWHLGRWPCLTIVGLVLWAIFFVGFDSLGGDVRKSPWGLLAIVIFAHNASEGGLDSLIYELFYGVSAMLIVTFFSSKIMPHLGALIIGPGRTSSAGGAVVQSIPRRSGTF